MPIINSFGSDYRYAVNPRDVLARITRALEALRDGDREFAKQLLDDLVADVWTDIELEEKNT